MVAAGDYLERKIYDHIFRGQPFSLPSMIAIGLTNSVPIDSGAYLEVANANNYARYPNASGAAIWSNMDLVAGSGTNLQAFTFNEATGNWGTVSGVVITDSTTHSGGNMLLWGALNTPTVITSGNVFSIPVSGIAFIFH